MAAKSLSIAGAIYPDVPSVNLPVSGGGSASYVETSDATATADKIMLGYTAYVDGQLVVGTATPGGGGVVITETPDTAGGTVLEITSSDVLDISDTTAEAADVAVGKYFYTSAGVKTEGISPGLTYEDVSNGMTISPAIDLVLETATQIRERAFSEFVGINSCHAKKVTKIGGYAFAGSRITKFVCETRMTGGNYNVFSSCPLLQAIDIDFSGSFSNGWLQNCTALNTIVLRRTNAITSIASSSHLNGTPFAEGGSGGTLYVPSALKETYEANANWSAIIARENNRIETIEGSIYETQYVDGVPIS